MMTNVVVRQRGQVTIPDDVRNMVAWLSEGSAVGLEMVEKEMLILRPHVLANTKIFDWNKILNKINLSRSFKGRNGDLSTFIIEDRSNH